MSVILSKNVYMYTCPIPNGFRGSAISLYRSLDLAPNIVRHYRRTAPLYEACKWVWRVGRLLYVDTRDELLDLVMDVIASINEHKDTLRRATRHVLRHYAKCTEVDGRIFENVLHQVTCTNFVTWTINTGTRNNMPVPVAARSKA